MGQPYFAEPSSWLLQLCPGLPSKRGAMQVECSRTALQCIPCLVSCRQAIPTALVPPILNTQWGGGLGTIHATPATRQQSTAQTHPPRWPGQSLGGRCFCAQIPRLPCALCLREATANAVGAGQGVEVESVLAASRRLSHGTTPCSTPSRCPPLRRPLPIVRLAPILPSVPILFNLHFPLV